MTIHRHNPRRDANERAIVDALRRLGCRVLQISGRGLPDLAVYYPAVGWLLGEVKTAKGKLRATQSDWGDEIRVWRTLDDVLADLGVIRR